MRMSSLVALPHDERGEREFLCDLRAALSALDFVVEVGEAANYPAEQRLAPALGAFRGAPQLVEHVVVLAHGLCGIGR